MGAVVEEVDPALPLGLVGSGDQEGDVGVVGEPVKEGHGLRVPAYRDHHHRVLGPHAQLLPDLGPALHRRAAHREHFPVRPGIPRAERLGQEVQVGLVHPSIQRVSQRCQGRRLRHQRLVEPGPQEVLDQDGGKARPLCHRHPQRRDVAEDRGAPGALHLQRQSRHQVVVEGDHGLQRPKRPRHVHGEGGTLDEAHVHRHLVVSVQAGYRLVKEPPGSRGEDLEADPVTPVERLHDGGRTCGVAEAVR